MNTEKTAMQELQDKTVDTGQLFDENADCTKDLGTAWFDEAIHAMSKEKFIELYNQRTPDAGQLEKIIGDAFDAGEKYGSSKFRWQESSILSKAQYIKQAMDQFKNSKK